MTSEAALLLVVLAGLVVSLVCSYLGKRVLFAYLFALLVGVNVASAKITTVLGWHITVGTPIYAVTFMISNMVSERYGKPTAHRAVWQGFCVVAGFVLVGLLSRLVPAGKNEVSAAVDLVFRKSTRILTASFVTYLIAQHTDVILYAVVRRLSADRAMWLRNIVSSVAAEFLDSLLFFGLAFAGENIVWEGKHIHWTELAVTGFVVKSLIAFLDTPVLYLAKRIGTREVL